MLYASRRSSVSYVHTQTHTHTHTHICTGDGVSFKKRGTSDILEAAVERGKLREMLGSNLSVKELKEKLKLLGVEQQRIDECCERNQRT
jgi:hypothetical protein